MRQVDALEADLSAARKGAAGQATEMAELSKRLSDSLARSAKLDDKVGMPAPCTFLPPMQCPCCQALHTLFATVTFRARCSPALS